MSLKFNFQAQNSLFPDDEPSDHLLSIHKQIEIFENGFIEDIPDLPDFQEEPNIQRKRLKTIDFSDVNKIFGVIRDRALKNGNFENLAKVMQGLCLIDGKNEVGVWEKIRQGLANCHKEGKGRIIFINIILIAFIC